jgi:hypothetical protein
MVYRDYNMKGILKWKIQHYLRRMQTDLSGILDKLMPLGFELATGVDVRRPWLVRRAQYGHPLCVFWRDQLHCVGGAPDVYGRVILNLTNNNMYHINLSPLDI